MLYRILAGRGPMTSAELADAAGLSERYVRERLEQQAVSALLDVDDPRADVQTRRTRFRRVTTRLSSMTRA